MIQSFLLATVSCACRTKSVDGSLHEAHFDHLQQFSAKKKSKKLGGSLEKMLNLLTPKKSSKGGKDEPKKTKVHFSYWVSVLQLIKYLEMFCKCGCWISLSLIYQCYHAITHILFKRWLFIWRRKPCYDKIYMSTSPSWGITCSKYESYSQASFAWTTTCEFE